MPNLYGQFQDPSIPNFTAQAIDLWKKALTLPSAFGSTDPGQVAAEQEAARRAAERGPTPTGGPSGASKVFGPVLSAIGSAFGPLEQPGQPPPSTPAEELAAALGTGLPSDQPTAAQYPPTGVPMTPEEQAAPPATAEQISRAMAGTVEGLYGGPQVQMLADEERAARAAAEAGVVSNAAPTPSAAAQGAPAGEMNYPLSPTLLRALGTLEEPITYTEPPETDYSRVRAAVEAGYPGAPPETGMLDRLAGALGGLAQGALVAGGGRHTLRAAGTGALLGGLGAGRAEAAAYQKALAEYNKRNIETEQMIFEDVTEMSKERLSQRAQTAREKRKAVQDLVQTLKPQSTFANNRMIVGSIDPDTGSYRIKEWQVNPYTDALTQAMTSESWQRVAKMSHDIKTGGGKKAPAPKGFEAEVMAMGHVAQVMARKAIQDGHLPPEAEPYVAGAVQEYYANRTGETATAATRKVYEELGPQLQARMGQGLTGAGIDQNQIDLAIIMEILSGTLGGVYEPTEMPPKGAVEER